MDLRDYLGVIFKHKWTIIMVFVVIVTTAVIHAFSATPIYKAKTRLIIDKENPNVVSIQEVMAVDASGTDYFQTQYKIIESRSVAREVIKRLNLSESDEFFPKTKDDFISNFKGTIQGIKRSINASITSLFKRESAITSKELEEHNPDYQLVSDFCKRIDVKAIRNSRLVDIHFEAKDPVLAANIVNTLAKAYIDRNLETKLKAVQDAVKWLSQRMAEERKRVAKAEEALLQYKKTHNIVTDFSSDTEKVTAQKLAELNTQVVDAESRRVEAETRYNQAMAMAKNPEMLDSIPEVLSNELIKEIKAMEVDLYKRISELSEKYGQKHPQMIAVRSELETLKKRKTQEIDRVVNSLRNEYQVARAKERSLKAALANQKNESLELNQKAIQYSALSRETESARQMYELLIKRFKEASLTEDMKTGNIRVIDPAEVPKYPVKPRKKQNILLAAIVGLFLGVGLAFFFEYLDNTIKIPEDIKRYLQIPYLGPVPVIGGEANPRDGKSPETVTVDAPKSTASEAYRGIRTSILFSTAETEPQVILVSSAGPQEGKTITAVNVGIAMAQAGNKTIILDCDLRRPKLHKIFGLNRDEGMTNLLTGKTEAGGLIAKTTVPGLDVIPCGPIPPNPSEILGAGRMAKLLEVLRSKYNRIIIDSPPITAVTDAVVLAKSVDGVVLVISANETAREVVRNGVEQLRSVGARILGAVLNGVNMGRDSYYYQYYYYYYGDDAGRKKRSRRKKKSESAYGA